MLPLDGQKIADEILERLREKSKPKKFLAGVIVGHDPASESFQRIKQKTAEKLGLDYRIYHLGENLSQDKLRKEIGRISAHKTCGGVIVQLPLPRGLDRHYVLNAIPREKDPDVLSERSLGALYTGRNPVLPPAAATVAEIIDKLEMRTANLSVAVVGPGFLIGKPVANWLLGKCREIFVLDKHSDLGVLKKCDLVITGAGIPGLIKPDMLKTGAGIIDFGYGKSSAGVLTGDFDSSGISEKSKVRENSESFYTPTPGGTGPILVAKLMENFYILNR